MFSSRTMRKEDWKEIKNFTAAEFVMGPERIPCADKMGYEFMLWLDDFREQADVPMTITSSSRTRIYNKMVGGASDSAHVDVPCNSVDIGMRPRKDDPNWNFTRWELMTTAARMGCKRIGMYSNGSLHFDRTEDQRAAPRIWVVVAGHP